VQTDQITALVGTNESGKTNILLPLAKLKGEEIDPAADYPRKLYATARNEKPARIFIEAVFSVASDVARTLGLPQTSPSANTIEFSVARRYDGSYEITCPCPTDGGVVPSSDVLQPLRAAQAELAVIPPQDSETVFSEAIKKALESAVALVPVGPCTHQVLGNIVSALDAIGSKGASDISSLLPPVQRAIKKLRTMHSRVAPATPAKLTKENIEAVTKAMPRFVYYSNYGNLDSEIYLPHVIENLKRKDVGQKEAAKARTLRVLFAFVGLNAEEILELGKEPSAEPSHIESAADKKTQRAILLDSASARLTTEFRKFWKQGEYTFEIRADGTLLRIWVSDSIRPQKIELEGRSAGLQWFLSFFLVFLVESDGEHKNAVLLLDEPGLSLHPIAQLDLSAFFAGLAETNQLLYTTHSPFLLDYDNLARARKVYVDSAGTSRVTSDLGMERDGSKRGAGYTVFAAIGIGVAESVLLGCAPVIVEGPSDQHYLTAMKAILIAKGLISPARDLVFPPAGGVSGVKAIASILMGRNNRLPAVLLDSDSAGTRFTTTLRSEYYSAEPQRVLQVGSFTSVINAEIEDLIPSDSMCRALDRWQRTTNTSFRDVFTAGQAIVPQIEQWATNEGVVLDKGWKPELAKRVKMQLLDAGAAAVPADSVECWRKLFEELHKQV